MHAVCLLERLDLTLKSAASVGLRPPLPPHSGSLPELPPLPELRRHTLRWGRGSPRPL